MIPVCTPLIRQREAEYVMSCLRDNWISSFGKYIPALEEAFSRYYGKK